MVQNVYNTDQRVNPLNVEEELDFRMGVKIYVPPRIPLFFPEFYLLRKSWGPRAYFGHICGLK